MLSFRDLRKKLRTPNFVENNGGWWAFLIFIGVPAVLAIVGVVDPISDFFFSFFSADKNGHIATSWPVKYSLFIVFFFLIPTLIYLLCIRLNPAQVKRKSEKAYGLISKEVSRIYSQMYGPPHIIRHNLQVVHFVYRVDSAYGLRCDGKIKLRAKEDLHFWKYAVGAEADGDGQDFISDIDFDIKVSGQSSAFLPLKDSSHDKEIMIAFLPYIQQNSDCEVDISWIWPKCMGQLRDRGSEEYDWTCESADTNCSGEFYLQYVFDRKLGDIQCRNLGMNPPGASLQRTDKANEIIWTFDVKNAPLGKGNNYRLVFERR